MHHDEAVRIVVQAGKEGQKQLLEALFEEMKAEDLDEICRKNGYTLLE